MLLQKLSQPVAGNAMGAVSISDAEITLWNSPNLRAWWRGGYGVSGSGTGFNWTDMKGAKQLTGVNSNTPNTITNAFNGRSSLNFPTALYIIQDLASQAFISTSGSFSIGVVIRKSTSSDAAMIAKATTGFELRHLAAGQIRVRHDKSVATGQSQTSGTYGYTNPLAALYSFNKALTQARLYVNGTLDGSRDDVSASPADDVLQLQPIGEFFDLMVWNTAVHDTANAGTLAALYPYATARYGI